MKNHIINAILKKPSRQTLKIFWKHSMKFPFSFWINAILSPLAVVFLYILLPYCLSLAIGTFSTGDYESLQKYIVWSVIVAILGVIINAASAQAFINQESKVRKTLVDELITELISKDADFFSNQKVGSLAGKFIDFVNTHSQLVHLFLRETLRMLATIIVGLVLIFTNSTITGFVVVGFMIVLVSQIFIFIKIREPYRLARKKTISELNGITADAIVNNSTVKIFAAEQQEQSNIAEITEKYRQILAKDSTISNLEGFIRRSLSAAFQIAVIAIIAKLLLDGKLELGIAIFIVTYIQRISSEIFTIGHIITDYDRLFIQSAPFAEILMTPNKITDKSNSRNLNVQNGKIELSNLSYRYSDSDKNVLDNINITINAGEKVGIVGRSGAGKTTLTKLLLRLDDPTDGKILIDDQNIQNVSQKSLRESISYVPQEPLMFHRSIRENITYGKNNATEDEIITACKQSGAWEFIKDIPKGLDAIVGERGMKLSGGQRQRVAIARALLKNSPILIMDEATSALDSESEKHIQKSLEFLTKNRTSIIVAHRLSTVAKLDRIIVIEKGKVIEDGTHNDLIIKNGTYAKLWSHQGQENKDEQ